jgi:hypothetical protein
MNTSTLAPQFSFEQIIEIIKGLYKRAGEVRWLPHGLCRYSESQRYKMIHERELRGPMGADFRRR